MPCACSLSHGLDRRSAAVEGGGHGGPAAQVGGMPVHRGRRSRAEAGYQVSCAPNFTNRASRMFTGTCHAGP